jgi:galactose mutarotase-like enzyme
MIVPLSSAGRITLQTETITVDAVPYEGGRIASLRSRATGLEFLTQTRSSSRGALESGMDVPFREGPCAGIEECLPTVAPCGAETTGGPAPDHGDFWQLPWQVIDGDARRLAMEAIGFSRPLSFRKTLLVDDNALRVTYTICNVGSTEQSFLYACHPLFAVDAGDYIMLPEGVDTLRLDYSRHHRLGSRGDTIAWPSSKKRIALDKTLSAAAGTADMLYTGRLTSGICSIQRTITGESLTVEFSTEVLPYLGVWLCYGGWPDDATDNLQYAVALEPTTAPFNSLDEAQRAGAATLLAPGASYTFDVTFRIDSPRR